MKRYVLLAVLLFAAAPLAAQASIVLPDKELAPEHARFKDAAYVLRDTLFGVTSAAARLRRDFSATSAASLTSRARDMVRACEAVSRNTAAPRAAVRGVPEGTRLQERERTRLLAAYDALDAAAATCAREFGTLAEPGRGEEVRGYGNRHASRMVEQVRRYERALDGYFRALDIPNRPRGARPDPLAG